MDPILKERAIRPISDEELERRWTAAREVMKEKKVDFLLIENNNDYLGGYIKWFTDVPAVHSYPISAIFPVPVTSLPEIILSGSTTNLSKCLTTAFIRLM